MTSGFSCILHFHTCIEDCTIDLICELNRQNKEEKKVKLLKSFSKGRVNIKTTNPICGEKFEVIPSLGRFTLRDEGKYINHHLNLRTIAIGRILKYKQTMDKY